MTYTAIDPDGLLAMSTAVLASSTSVHTIGEEIRAQTDRVAHLVGGAPASSTRAAAIAEELATLAGWARDHALEYVDDIRPLEELREAGYWLPDLSNLAWDESESAGENIDRILRSDEVGAGVLGTAGGLLERYRNWRLHVPNPHAPAGAAARLNDLIATPPDDVVNGRPVVRRASGLLVPQGSSGDPRVRQITAAGDEATYRPGRRLVPDPNLGRPPAWARNGGRALGVLGTGLTLYDSAISQWQHDQQYHPDMGTGERVARAGYNVVTEGGGAVAGGLAGAKIGATLGAFGGPVGMIVGGVVGGAIGSFIGSKAGKAAGRALKEGGKKIADGAKKVWKGLFG